MPILDYGVPRSTEKMTAILDTIDDAINEGHIVYVHYWGCVRPTGTVVNCYLMRLGKTGDQALDELTFHRQTVEKRFRFPRTLEYDRQAHYIRDWESVEAANRPT